jgi:Chlorophyll A-B binding protein
VSLILHASFCCCPLCTSLFSGKAQIFGTILIAEIASESNKPHYMKGGAFPTVVFPKFDFSKVDPVTLKTKQSRELNNGRLAQIAIISFLCERAIPGSVPALSGLEAFH